jgi:hypothetical protein
MPQLHLSDEILMAFADGEIEGPVAVALEEAMQKDATITKRVADFLKSRRLVRAAYAQEEPLSVSPQLQAAVMSKIQATEASWTPQVVTKPIPFPTVSRRTRLSPILLPLAASVAAFAFGILGYLAGQQSQTEPAARANSIAQLENPLVDDVLSKNVSAEDHPLPIGTMRVLSTFRSGAGDLCREFTLKSPKATTDAISCRDGGGWNIRFALAGEPAPTTYGPSGEPNPVEVYTKSIGAGATLSRQAEIEALSSRTP